MFILLHHVGNPKEKYLINLDDISRVHEYENPLGASFTTVYLKDIDNTTILVQETASAILTLLSRADKVI